MRCRSLLKSVLPTLLLFSLAVNAASDKNILIVDLVVNHQSRGNSFVLSDSNGAFFVDEATLVAWEILKPWPTPEVFRGSNYYALNNFAGATADLNSRLMRLEVTLPPHLMPNRSVGLAQRDTTPVSADFGLYLDYQVNWQKYEFAESDSTFLTLKPVVFGKYGNISANTIYRHSSQTETGEFELQDGMNVLELTYTLDDPEQLRSLRIGDVFTRPGPQGRALRIGGIQLATNFETQPEFITYPLPRFFGEASVPTALDVYVNGQLRRRTNVEPGSYVVEDLPVINGLGQLQVVTRDALGQQQVYTQDFYTDTDLLRQGLSDYAVTIGALRENYGFENFAYGDFAAAGTWRYGWREDTTVQGHAELSRDIAMVSTSVRHVLPSGGVISSSVGLSRNSAGTGVGWRIGFNERVDVLNYAIDVSGSTSRYAMVGQLEAPPKLQVFATAGRNFFELGNIGGSVVRREFHNRPSQTIYSANYTKSFSRNLVVSSYVSYLDHQDDNLVIGLRFSMPFGDRHYAGAGYNRSYDQDQLTAEVSKALPLGNGYGYRLAASTLDQQYLEAGLTLQNEIGTYILDVRNGDSGGNVWQASAVGSLAYLDGMTSFTRQIRDAFAVVNVGNFEGVRVYAENIEIGRTDENGKLFVPGLYPYIRNQVRIEVEDLPLNARIEQLETQAAPYYKSGIVINFDVRVSNNVLMRAVLPNGQPVPEGAYAMIDNESKRFPVGQNGKLFLQGIDRSSRITLRWREQACALDVPYPDSSAIISKLGDILCVPVATH